MVAAAPAGEPANPRRQGRPVTGDHLADSAAELLTAGFRLALVAAHDDGPELRVVYLFVAGSPDRRVELVVTLPADNPQLPSLSALSFPAGRFEREMHDLFGIVAVGHPQPRRLVRHAHWPAQWHPMRADAGVPPAFPDAAGFPFAPVDGAGVYEIPVGPVHAGMIEPGHFRFSVVGETILKLKARLWFTHRGVERLFQGRDALAGTELAERISGDTSAGHALAHALAVEDALGISVSAAAHRLRALLIELERLYNHAADLGALANDAGFGLANSHAGRIREELLRINEAVTGHRLLRGAITPGAVRLLALPDATALLALASDLADLSRRTLAKSVVHDRFAGTAVLTAAHARELGCLGPVARASGLAVDARLDHPAVPLPVQPATAGTGDVLARYTIRRDEFARSVDLVIGLCKDVEILDHATGLESGDLAALPPAGPKSNDSHTVRSGVGIVEGWRGTIVHRVEIDPAGRFSRVKIVDPSWFNWPAVPVALTDTIVPDFPLVNKSFNLSYAGNDL